MSKDVLTRLIASYSGEAAEAVRKVADAVVEVAADITTELNQAADELSTYTAKDVDEAFNKLTDALNGFTAPGTTPKPKPQESSTRNGFSDGERVVYLRVNGEKIHGTVDFTIPVLYPASVPVRTDGGIQDGYPAAHLVNELAFKAVTATK